MTVSFLQQMATFIFIPLPNELQKRNIFFYNVTNFGGFWCAVAARAYFFFLYSPLLYLLDVYYINHGSIEEIIFELRFPETKSFLFLLIYESWDLRSQNTNGINIFVIKLLVSCLLHLRRLSTEECAPDLKFSQLDEKK